MKIGHQNKLKVLEVGKAKVQKVQMERVIMMLPHIPFLILPTDEHNSGVSKNVCRWLVVTVDVLPAGCTCM